MTENVGRSATGRANALPGPSIDMDGVEDQIGFVLRLAQLAVFKDVFETLTPFGLRPSDFSALRVIAANPALKQQDVGRRLGVKGPNLVSLIEALRRKHLLSRKVAPGDRRSYALTLTKAGHALLQQAVEAHEDHQARLRHALSENDRAILLACLHRLALLGAPASSKGE